MYRASHAFAKVRVNLALVGVTQSCCGFGRLKVKERSSHSQELSLMDFSDRKPCVYTRLGQTDMIPSSVLVYDWEVRDFDRICPKNGQTFNALVSKRFTAGEDLGKGSRWHAECKPENGNLNVYLFLDELVFEAETINNNNNTSITAKVDMAILRSNGEDIVRFPKRYSFNLSARSSYKSLASMETLWQNQAFLEKNTLRLQILLEIFGDKVTNPKPHQVLTRKWTEAFTKEMGQKLQADLSTLFTNRIHTDSTIICGNRTFHVHRAILSARSSVFAAMFHHDTKESQNNCVEIDDSDPNVIDTVLRYMYSGKLDDVTLPDDVIATVIPFADKYGLAELKRYCFQQLLMKLSTDTFGPLAVLVYLHGSDESLTGFVKNYYETNWPILMQNDECRNTLLKYPEAFLIKDSINADSD